MRPSRTVRAAVVGALLGAVAVAGMVGSAYSSPAVEAQAAHHAVVVVGTDARCVTFSEESISGTEALSRAGFSAVVRSYTGEGGAVCAINGTGCAADANCLTCQAPNYWAYFRSESGSGGFTYSSGAATSSQVTDGDVEGWRWGTGAAPSYRSVADVCPLPTTTTTSTTNPPAHNGGGNHGGGNNGGSNNGGSNNGGPNNGGPTGGPTGTPGSSDTPDDTTPAEPGATTTLVPPTTVASGGPNAGGSATAAGDDGESVDGEEAAAVSPLADDDGGGGTRTWIAFAAILGGFGLAGWRIRRLRSHSG
jgi:hypothetical protein